MVLNIPPVIYYNSFSRLKLCMVICIQNVPVWVWLQIVNPSCRNCIYVWLTGFFGSQFDPYLTLSCVISWPHEFNKGFWKAKQRMLWIHLSPWLIRSTNGVQLCHSYASALWMWIKLWKLQDSILLFCACSVLKLASNYPLECEGLAWWIPVAQGSYKHSPASQGPLTE